ARQQRQLVGPLGNLGALYFAAAQYSRAEKVITRALDIVSITTGPPGTKATLLANLGSVYISEHKDDLAQEKGEEVLSLFSSSDPSRAWAYSILGAVHLHAGRYAEAEEYMKQALAIRQSRLRADDPQIADGLANLATVYSQSDQPEKVEPLFRQANAI